MVSLQNPAMVHNSELLTLPAELRSRIWRLLFKDSRVVYKVCVDNKDLSTERYQIVHSCRFAYQETFALLWSRTTIKYSELTPAQIDISAVLDNWRPILSRTLALALIIAMSVHAWQQGPLGLTKPTFGNPLFGMTFSTMSIMNLNIASLASFLMLTRISSCAFRQSLRAPPCSFS
jgi:hypothetical protein